MQVNGHQLEQALQQELKPVYLVFTDDPFLAGQAQDAIRSVAQQAGFDERIRLTQDKEFNWAELQQAGQTMSLFTSRQLIELALPEGKPGREGGAALTEFAEQQTADQVLLLTGPKLRKEQLNSKWFKALSSKGVQVQLYTPDAQSMPGFIRDRANHHQLTLDADAVALLALWYEGNLLALDQELTKLALLYPQQQVGVSELESASKDQSRYDIFALRDAAVKKDLKLFFHILERLEELGEEPVLILWALSGAQQSLDRIAGTLHDSQALNATLQQERIWSSQKNMWLNAARHWQPDLNHQVLQLLKRAELAIKRDTGEDPFVLFAHAGALLCNGSDLNMTTTFALAEV